MQKKHYTLYLLELFQQVIKYKNSKNVKECNWRIDTHHLS